VPHVADWCAINMLRDQTIERIAIVQRDLGPAAGAATLDRRYPASAEAAGVEASVLHAGAGLIVPHIADELAGTAASHSDQLSELRQLGLHAAILIPIAARGAVIGDLILATADPDRHFDQDDLRLAERIAQHAAIAVDNARLLADAHAAVADRDAALARIDAIIEQLPTGVIVVEAPSGRVIVANEQVEQLLGRRLLQLGEDGGDGIGLHPDGRPLRLAELPLRSSLASGEVVTHEELQVLRADKTPGTIRVTAGPVRDRDGRIIAGVMVVNDITGRKQAEREQAGLLERERQVRGAAELASRRLHVLAEASKLFDTLLDYPQTLRAIVRLPLPVLADACAVDLLGEDGGWRRVAVAHLDPDREALLDEAARRFGTLQSSEEILAAGEPVLFEDMRALLDGPGMDPEHLALQQRVGLGSAICAPLAPRGRPLGVLSLGRGFGAPPFTSDDLTFAGELAVRVALAIDTARQHQQLRHEAHTDPLTGLANRALFMDHLRMALARGRRHPATVAVLFFDLDRFKAVNDSLGHTAGDGLLTAVAERLESALRPSDTIARLGGDEFAVLCEGLNRDYNAVTVAQRILDTVAQPCALAGRDVVVTPSIGIAVASGPEDAETLLRNADAAMYRAKARGGARHELFDHAMREQAGARLRTEALLRHAVDRDELRLHFQPIVAVADGQLVGAEALLRWQRPGHDGLVMPDEFIPLAEETGLIRPIGGWVLDRACEQAARWQASDPTRQVRVGINLSSAQLGQADLAGHVAAAVRRTGADPALLCLEITETVLLGDSDASAGVVHELKALGLQIGIDDFGTGYSSFDCLRRLPVDWLKIDRSFVAGLGSDQRGTTIVGAMISMAHALRLPVVAEGVETPGQLDQLRQLGCDTAQGFLFAGPDDDDAVDRLARYSSAR
jgi:diguanylate cyclase (GGDEF)-like protein/PAS domain S-box-containing protein